MGEWPRNWAELTRGIGCEMCENGRPDANRYGVRVHAGRYTDAYLQRADVQRGYTVVIWRGRHVTEPTELDAAEASGYWAEVLAVARALIDTYKPLKMNYETLGNSLPHLHTHLIPRFTDDPRPGQPFPLSAKQPDAKVPETQLHTDAKALREILDQARPPRAPVELLQLSVRLQGRAYGTPPSGPRPGRIQRREVIKHECVIETGTTTRTKSGGAVGHCPTWGGGHVAPSRAEALTGAPPPPRR